MSDKLQLKVCHHYDARARYSITGSYVVECPCGINRIMDDLEKQIYLQGMDHGGDSFKRELRKFLGVQD